MSATLTPTRDGILEQIEGYHWIHTIDLGHGVMTPGDWPVESKRHIMRAIEPLDFAGRKVLDVGCLDGLFTFEAERRGAKRVVAADLVTQVFPPRDTTFQVAHRLVGSKAEYHPDLSVYDVGRLGVKDFDVVLYLGVYYHLRDPLLSFARLRQVMKDGAIIVVEGEVLAAEPACLARFYYREHFGWDKSNWWIPSIPCLRQWVESCYFEIVEEYPANESHGYHHYPDLATGRHTLVARAVSRKDDNWAFPDAELRAFDRNDYTPDQYEVR